MAPGSDTTYAVVAKDGWTDITWGSMPADKRVTDVYSINGVIYICFGVANNTIGLQVYNNAGTWTEDWHTDSDISDLMYQVPGFDQKMLIWEADRWNSTINKADAKDGTGAATVDNLTWGVSDIFVGDTRDAKIIQCDILERVARYWPDATRRMQVESFCLNSELVDSCPGIEFPSIGKTDAPFQKFTGTIIDGTNEVIIATYISRGDRDF